MLLPSAVEVEMDQSKTCFGCIKYKNKHVISLPLWSSFLPVGLLCIYLVTLRCVFMCSVYLRLKTVKINKKTINAIDFHQELTAGAGIKLYREIMTYQRGDLQPNSVRSMELFHNPQT